MGGSVRSTAEPLLLIAFTPVEVDEQCNGDQEKAVTGKKKINYLSSGEELSEN